MPQPVIVRLPNQMSVLLRARRKYLRITQKDVAFRLGITQPREDVMFFVSRRQ